MSKKKITIAIASDFLTAFSRIPRKQQGKVLDFINKFRSNPSMPSIHYEKIQHAKDPNLRSVRIDQVYRGIVLKPEKGNAYMLLWVDHHDKAYQ
ncbi:MAG: DNA helicase, partial [Deltaproteobacteria bacterium]